MGPLESLVMGRLWPARSGRLCRAYGSEADFHIPTLGGSTSAAPRDCTSVLVAVQQAPYRRQRGLLCCREAARCFAFLFSRSELIQSYRSASVRLGASASCHHKGLSTRWPPLIQKEEGSIRLWLYFLQLL